MFYSSNLKYLKIGSLEIASVPVVGQSEINRLARRFDATLDVATIAST